ncbi:hypothetical protein ACIO3R_07245 [Streptomyces sp. NPDC087428]|uniref:hypothetical protein n=1 Tax=Streptomyces sp. NPDC087428 TaxID=3365788 RepID=UPI003812AC57
MPAHKMIAVDGIRYRPEDAPRAHARPAADGPLSMAQAEPAAPVAVFDPAAHDVPAVLAHLADADEDETQRVLAAEAAGKNRKTILEAGA